ncbi:MAG TPA: hypothetical protein VGP91_09155 [Actinoplanes sp.]|jgi:hypothetical protein|nr:hypothetical protein [Actinoplanes sp.]
MRTTGALALMLMLTLAGCAARNGGDGVATANGKPTATASSQPSTNDEDAPLKFAQCMRQHGMSWFPDPQPGSRGMQIKIPPGQDKAKVDAAMEACKKYMPGGGEPGKLDPQALEQARQMAKCMREHGVPNFPDPNANGQIQIDGNKLGMAPGDPTFDAAEKACAQYAPKGSATERKVDKG